MNKYATADKSSSEVKRRTNVFKRTRYFHGMLLDESDLACEQSYNIEKRRVLNQMLNGRGVIRGFDVKAAESPDDSVIIKPGLALDCSGNEIQVKEECKVTLTKDHIDSAEVYVYGNQSTAKTAPVAKIDDQNQYKYYIAVGWIEELSDKRASFAPPKDDEDPPCGYSRMGEGFCIKIFKTPASDDIPIESKITEMITECQDNENKLECLNNALKSYQVPLERQPFPNPGYTANNNPYVVLGTIKLNSEESQTLVIEPDMISVIEGRIYAHSSPFWRHFLAAFFNPIVEYNRITDKKLNDVIEKLNNAIEDIKELQKTHIDHKHFWKYVDLALPLSALSILFWLIYFFMKFK